MIEAIGSDGYFNMSNAKKVDKPSLEDLVQGLYEQNDVDKNGALTIEELDLEQDSFAAFDQNGDGAIEMQEMLKPLKALKMMSKNNESQMNKDSFFQQISDELLENKDIDGNGSLNMEELGASEDLFSYLDQDEDGEIQGDEIVEGLKSLGINENKGQKNKPVKEDEEEESDEVEIIGNGIDDDGDGEIDEIDSNSVFSEFYSSIDTSSEDQGEDNENDIVNPFDIIA